MVCPVLERTAVALNDQAAERLGLTSQVHDQISILLHLNHCQYKVKRSGRDYQLRRNDAEESSTWVQPQTQPGRRLPYWMQLAARGAAWRKGRAVKWNRRTSENSKRLNLMQMILHPLNKIAAAI